MQAVRGEHVALDQGVDGLQREGVMPDQVCQRRHAQLYIFTNQALCLPGNSRSPSSAAGSPSADERTSI